MNAFTSLDIPLYPGESIDLFMEGRLKLIQSRRGYRFSIDAVLLSEFATVRQGDVAVDLGTGCGVILLILLLNTPVSYVVGLEIQEQLARQAARNAALNGYHDRMRVVIGDIRHLPLGSGIADVVLCNPPYRRADCGRLNPDPSKAIARHEILASMEDTLKAARLLLRRKGRLAIIYPAARLVDLTATLRRFDLEPKRMKMIYPTLRSSSKLTLVEAVLGGRPGVDITPPVIGQGASDV